MNMGEKVNSNGVDKWPMVSAGGKISLFVTGRNSGGKINFTGLMQELLKICGQRNRD